MIGKMIIWLILCLITNVALRALFYLEEIGMLICIVGLDLILGLFVFLRL